MAGDVYPTGLAFVLLNRWVVDNVRCSQLGNAGRQFSLIIESAAACAALGIPSVESCEVTTAADPEHSIVRAETVFKNKATKTFVTFYFISDAIHYRLTSDVSAQIIPIPTDASTATPPL